jgi:hypothetical protein
MSAPGKLVRSSRWKSGPSKGQRPLGSECCVATGDSGREAYTAIAWGVGLSRERSDIAGAESFHSLEGNMCGTAMRGADALPGSKATSRAKDDEADVPEGLGSSLPPAGPLAPCLPLNQNCRCCVSKNNGGRISCYGVLSVRSCRDDLAWWCHSRGPDGRGSEHLGTHATP